MLNLEGTITANGGTGGWHEGTGGSGGSIWVTTNMLTGSGYFQANGGNRRYDNYGAGGGGGRIAVHYTTDAGFTGFGASTANPGVSYHAAEPGSVVFVDHSVPGTHLRLYEHLVLGENSDVQVGQLTLAEGAKLTIGGGSILRVGGALTIGGSSMVDVLGKNTQGIVEELWAGAGSTVYAGSVSIEAGSRISADERGYRGGWAAYENGQGPGGGINTGNDWRAGGGGHGGAGGRGMHGGTGGGTYGSAVYPTALGSEIGRAHV